MTNRTSPSSQFQSLVVALLMFVMCSATTHAQSIGASCIYDELWLSTTPQARGYDLAVEGDILYTFGNDRLRTFDVSDPSAPELLGELEIEAVAMDAMGQFIYLAGWTNLLVVDATDPTNPVLIAERDTIWKPSDITAGDNGVYVVCAEEDPIGTSPGISGFDVTDPYNPRLRREQGVQGSFTQIDYIDGRLVVFSEGWDYHGGGGDIYEESPRVYFYEVAQPGSFTYLDRFETTSTIAPALSMDGDLLFMGNGIYDIVDPQYPVLLGEFSLRDVSDIIPMGERLYVSTRNNGPHVVDISDPTNPRVVDTYPAHNDARSLEISENMLYVIGTEDLQIFSIAAEEGFTQQAMIDMYLTDRAYQIDSIHESIAYAWVPNNPDPGNTLLFLDISDPHNPISLYENISYGERRLNLTYVPEHDLLIYTQRVRPDGSLLEFMDVSDPTNPVVLNTLEFSGSYIDFRVADDRLHLLSTQMPTEGSVYRILNFQGPLDVSLLSEHELVGRYYHLIVSGPYAYIGGGSDMQILDIRDPTTPTLANELNVRVSRFSISDTQALMFVSDLSRLGSIYDLTDPAAPELLSHILGSFYYADIIDNIGYISTYFGGVQIVDLHDPSSPVTLAASNSSELPYRITADGSVAKIYSTEGVRLLDISTDCQQCEADMNGDGLLNGDDAGLFLDVFNSSDLSADFTVDGILDIFDVFAFIDLYNAGCP